MSWITSQEYRNIKDINKDDIGYDTYGNKIREIWLEDANGDRHLIKIKFDGK